jgi:hypothetical protein
MVVLILFEIYNNFDNVCMCVWLNNANIEIFLKFFNEKKKKTYFLMEFRSVEPPSYYWEIETNNNFQVLKLVAIEFQKNMKAPKEKI